MTDSMKPRLYGRRKGRPLRAARAALMENFLPEVSVVLPSKGGLDLSDMFGGIHDSIALEIGFGGGEHLAAQAAMNPQTGYIGCEYFVDGVASLVRYVHEQGLRNVRIWPDDARVLLEALPESCLDTCFVLYADPWPKKRHESRRFIGKENLDRLARVIKAGGQLRLATDVEGLACWMREQCAMHDAFACVYDGPIAPDDWVPTRYEQKGIAAGRSPAYFIYKRN